MQIILSFAGLHDNFDFDYVRVLRRGVNDLLIVSFSFLFVPLICGFDCCVGFK